MRVTTRLLNGSESLIPGRVYGALVRAGQSANTEAFRDALSNVDALGPPSLWAVTQQGRVRVTSIPFQVRRSLVQADVVADLSRAARAASINPQGFDLFEASEFPTNAARIADASETVNQTVGSVATGLYQIPGKVAKAIPAVAEGIAFGVILAVGFAGFLLYVVARNSKVGL